MDSKILCVSLLLGVFCLWSTGASPLEEATGPAEYSSDDDMRADVQQKSATVVNQMATKYANKAKALEAQSKLYQMISKERHYYYREHARLADEYKKRAREYEALAEKEKARIGGHLERQKEWESKAREADTQSKELRRQLEQLYSTAEELYRNSAIAYSEAAIAEAVARGLERRADRNTEFAREMKQKAENMMNTARVHYTRGKENENRAAAEKVKAHQHAESSQKHNAASRAYQQEALKTRISSTNNVLKYIQNMVMAERTHNQQREELVKSELEAKMARELMKMAEETSMMQKILTRQHAYHATQAKQDEGRSQVLHESSREVGSLPGEHSGLIKMAEAGDELPDEERYHRLSVFEADDPVKNLASEEKDGSQFADAGF